LQNPDKRATTLAVNHFAWFAHHRGHTIQWNAHVDESILLTEPISILTRDQKCLDHFCPFKVAATLEAMLFGPRVALPSVVSSSRR